MYIWCGLGSRGRGLPGACSCRLCATHPQRCPGRRRVAKFAGDKRADVAEKSFGRPYSKIVVAESGLAK